MTISLDEARKLCPELVELERAQVTRIAMLEAQIEWFKRQIWGARSERRAAEAVNLDSQLWLGMELMPVPVDPPTSKTTVKEYERDCRPKPTKFTEDDSQLRFGPEVPVQEIICVSPECQTIPEEERQLVGEQVVCRLAQRSAYVVLKYITKVYKRKDNAQFLSSAAPDSVLDRSCADVSFLAGLLVDKFQHHLPLYRQHQRLEQAGVHLARSTLTRLVHRTLELLEPVYNALTSSIFQSPILAIDETPTPAILKKGTNKQPGKIKNGYFWAFYGSYDEVFFLYSPSRSKEVVKAALKGFEGTILTDGYIAYESFAKEQPGILHAQCWAHARRNFIYAEKTAEQQCQEVLRLFQQLYKIEQEAELGSEELRRLREQKSRPVVETIFAYLNKQVEESLLLPTNAFLKAAQYVLDRREALSVFLDNPDVALDTNHVERAIRPSVVGRKNWLFNFTETGARYTAMAYSLIQSCVAAKINPTVYLIDVLQRISIHPALEVHLLTPRMWAQHFAQAPLTSDLTA